MADLWWMHTHLSNGVVGGVDDDGLCLGVEFAGKLIWVKKPVCTRDRLLSRLLKMWIETFCVMAPEGYELTLNIQAVK